MTPGDHRHPILYEKASIKRPQRPHFVTYWLRWLEMAVQQARLETARALNGFGFCLW